VAKSLWEIFRTTLVNGRRIKLRYAHLGGSNPPIIIIHGNQTEKIPKAYERYLTHQFVQALKLKGTPLRVEFRTSNNPFKGENKGPGPQDRGRKGSITGVRKKL
jgi:GTP-binding protein